MHLLQHVGSPTVSKSTLAFETGLRSYVSAGKLNERPKFNAILSKNRRTVLDYPEVLPEIKKHRGSVDKIEKDDKKEMLSKVSIKKPIQTKKASSSYHPEELLL